LKTQEKDGVEVCDNVGVIGTINVVDAVKGVNEKFTIKSVDNSGDGVYNIIETKAERSVLTLSVHVHCKQVAV
jgi:hypothetical protein